MAGKVWHVGVVGASTLLGKELVEEISDSAAAAWDLKLLDEGDAIEGQLTAAGDEALVMHALDDRALAGLDLVLFAGAPALTTRFLPTALRGGAAVVDLTGAAQGQPGLLMRSPWMDAGPRADLTTTGIVVPHPAALMLALVAERLERRFGAVDVAATVLEPASEAGSAGVDELHQQTVNLLSFQPLPKEVFDAQVAFNVQGALGAEAQKNLGQSKSRLRADLRTLRGENAAGTVSVSMLQAPVFHNYVISAHVRLGTEVSVAAVRSALAGGIVDATEETAPSNQAVTESGDLLVSVEGEAEASRGCWLLLAADNLRLTARGAVKVALELAALRPGTRVQ